MTENRVFNLKIKFSSKAFVCCSFFKFIHYWVRFNIFDFPLFHLLGAIYEGLTRNPRDVISLSPPCLDNVLLEIKLVKKK